MTNEPPADMRWTWRAAGAVVVAVAMGGALSWRLRERLHDPPASEAAPTAPEALARTARDLELPTSARGESRPPPVVTILVTRGQLSVGGDPTPIAVFPEGLGPSGLPERYKRRGPSDLFISELHNSLQFWCDQAKARARDAGTDPADDVALLADRSTPYRVLLEVLFTAGQAELGTFAFGVRTSSGALAWITSTPPKMGGMGTRGHLSGALGLNAWISDEGVALHVSGGNIATGCQKLGSGVAVPKTGESYDPKALADCAVRLKHLRPAFAEDTQVAIGANPSVAYGTVVDAMNALGKNGDEPLFPDVVFSMLRPDTTNTSVNPGGIDPWGVDAPAVTAAPGQAPASAASIGGVALTGGRVANAEAVVAGMAAGFRRCYNKGLQEDPNMKGSIRITAKLTPNGEVLSASPSASGLSGTVVSCVTARVSSAQFSPPEGGAATLVIPVTFVTK